MTCHWMKHEALKSNNAYVEKKKIRLASLMSFLKRNLKWIKDLSVKAETAQIWSNSA